MPAILISDFVKAKLDAMKVKEEHKSLDSVIRTLLYERDKVRKSNTYEFGHNRIEVKK
jgi:hypothetical protein